MADWTDEIGLSHLKDRLKVIAESKEHFMGFTEMDFTILGGL